MTTDFGPFLSPSGGRRPGGHRHGTPVRRCETNYQSHEEQRIDGYDVIYAYHGRKYATTTPYDPGKKIKVRIDIRPAG